MRHLAPTLLVLAIASGAAAQTATSPPENAWSRGTSLSVFAGAASASSTRGPLAGGAFGWGITPWIGVEAGSAWLDRGAGASAFTASLTAQVNLTRPRTAVPFVMGGAGLYLATFDTSRSTLPPFYAERVESGVGVTRTFTDPAFVFGGGVNLFATPRWAIRPQVDAVVVRANSQSHFVSMLTVHLAYHFGDRTIRTMRRTMTTAPGQQSGS